MQCLSWRRAFPAALALLLLSTPSVLTPAALAQDRTVPLEGVKNTRDLGGLTTADGKTLRSGLLIRSGEIDHIDQAGKDLLDQMGVAAIIDLRTTKEATLAPAQWPEGGGPVRYNFPLMENESALIDEMRDKLKSGTAEADWMDQTFQESFAYTPIDYTDEIRGVFDVLLAQPDDTAVLYHCSGGKDRTGVVTALLLSALGVPRDQIEADFLFTNISVDADQTAAEVAAQINADQGTQMTAADVWPSVGVRPEYLARFYDSVTAEYGSIDNYLREGLGLSDEDIAQLRAKYLQ